MDSGFLTFDLLYEISKIPYCNFSIVINNAAMKNTIDDPSIPDVQDLERQFSLQRSVSFLLLFIFTSADIAVFLHVLTGRRPLFIILLFLQTAMSLYYLYKYYIPLLRLKRTELHAGLKEHTGNHGAGLILRAVEEVFGEYRKKEIPALYIIDNEKGGAFVIDTYILNFIRPLNAVYIPQHLLRIMTIDELKCTLAHELGHFYRYIHPVRRFIYPVYLFIMILPVLLISLYQSKLTITLLFLSYGILHTVVGKIHMYRSKDLEYLADYYAALRFGKINYVNTLLTLGRFSELTTAIERKILHKIKSDDTLQLSDFERIYREIISLHTFDRNFSEKTAVAVEKELMKESSGTSRARLTKASVRKKTAMINTFLSQYYAERKKVDWDRFDTGLIKRRIEKEEYGSFIEEILNNPDKVLVDSIVDDDSAAGNASHPDIRKRILFLEKNIQER